MQRNGNPLQSLQRDLFGMNPLQVIFKIKTLTKFILNQESANVLTARGAYQGPTVSYEPVKQRRVKNYLCNLFLASDYHYHSI